MCCTKKSDYGAILNPKAWVPPHQEARLLQALTSRPLVKAVLEKMPDTQRDTASRLGADPVAAVQAGLQATVVEGMGVVEVSSRGPDATFAAMLINELVIAYTGQLNDAYAKTSGSSLIQISDEVAQLTQKVQTQRRQMKDFRLRHNIVSFEREENEILCRVKGQTEALSELGRGYMPAYLAMDSHARAVRNRLAELERQIVNQRQSSGQVAQSDQSSALADARDDAAARDATARASTRRAGRP